MSTGPRQLALALAHEESLAREDFLTGPSNAAALALIDGWPDWPGRAVVLIGPEGSGKSHLAAIWAQAAGARSVAARAVGGGTGAGRARDRRAGGRGSRRPASSRSGRCFICSILPARRKPSFCSRHAARPPDGRWPCATSARGSGIAGGRLSPPDDALLRAVLVKLFADRQLAVDESLIGYLATRIERSFAAARAAVARLDREAMRQQRPLTRALAAELLRPDQS